MDAVKSKTADSFIRCSLQETSSDCEDNKLTSANKFIHTFSSQPLETNLKKLLTQVTGKTELRNITDVKLKVVSGNAGLHRLSSFTPNLRILILDGSCVASFRDLGSSLDSLRTLSVARCSMRHLDGVSGFRNLDELNVRENFVSDPSPCSGVRKLSKLDLSRNEILDISYFAFLNSCPKLRELRIDENHFADYRNEMRTLLPRLKILDGEEFEDLIQTDDVAKDDLSSEEDESSTSLSIENIIDFEEKGKFRADDNDEEKEKKFHKFNETLVNDSEDSDKSMALIKRDKSVKGKLTSGRVICGNLAMSLRTRNSTKLKLLSKSLDEKAEEDDESIKFGEEMNIGEEDKMRLQWI